MSTRRGRRKLLSVGIPHALLSRSDKQTTEKRPRLTDQCEDILRGGAGLKKKETENFLP